MILSLRWIINHCLSCVFNFSAKIDRVTDFFLSLATHWEKYCAELNKCGNEGIVTKGFSFYDWESLICRRAKKNYDEAFIFPTITVGILLDYGGPGAEERAERERNFIYCLVMCSVYEKLQQQRDQLDDDSKVIRIIRVY